MRQDFLMVALAVCLGAAGTQGAETAGMTDVPSAPASSKPYLAPAAEPDELAILPSPPARESLAARGEQDLFLATRTLADTPRWRLAINDADRSPNAVWADFGCALGAVIAAERVPAVIDLIGRLNEDVEDATRIAKAHYKRPRPLVGNDAPLCVPRTDKLAASYSFPSGHATQGWATALVLAELAPDRATQVLQRGKSFGDSRIVCGAHWASDVEAGRTAAAALVAVLHANAEFRRDLDEARAELATARQAHPSAPEAKLCHIEVEAAASSLP